MLLYGEVCSWNLARPGIRHKASNLWAEHLCGWGDRPKLDTGNRHSRLVSAHFEIPDCTKVTTMGYGQPEVHVSISGKGIKAEEKMLPTATGEEWWNDPHFNLSAVRIDVLVLEEQQ